MLPSLVKDQTSRKWMRPMRQRLNASFSPVFFSGGVLRFFSFYSSPSYFCFSILTPLVKTQSRRGRLIPMRQRLNASFLPCFLLAGVLRFFSFNSIQFRSLKVVTILLKLFMSSIVFVLEVLFFRS